MLGYLLDLLLGYLLDLLLGYLLDLGLGYLLGYLLLVMLVMLVVLVVLHSKCSILKMNYKVSCCVAFYTLSGQAIKA